VPVAEQADALKLLCVVALDEHRFATLDLNRRLDGDRAIGVLLDLVRAQVANVTARRACHPHPVAVALGAPVVAGGDRQHVIAAPAREFAVSEMQALHDQTCLAGFDPIDMNNLGRYPINATEGTPDP
jgi:hypothetical protein